MNHMKIPSEGGSKFDKLSKCKVMSERCQASDCDDLHAEIRKRQKKTKQSS